MTASLSLLLNNMATKVLLFSVGKKDLIRQTFRAGGKGGQNQNKVESGVRFIHPPSGARGEARDARDQKTNERNAFVRLVDTELFKRWHKAECAIRMGQKVVEIKSVQEIQKIVDREVEEDLRKGLVLVETFEGKTVTKEKLGKVPPRDRA